MINIKCNGKHFMLADDDDDDDTFTINAYPSKDEYRLKPLSDTRKLDCLFCISMGR
jgi:hypothetical protein